MLEIEAIRSFSNLISSFCLQNYQHRLIVQNVNFFILERQLMRLTYFLNFFLQFSKINRHISTSFYHRLDLVWNNTTPHPDEVCSLKENLLISPMSSTVKVIYDILMIEITSPYDALPMLYRLNRFLVLIQHINLTIQKCKKTLING